MFHQVNGLERLAGDMSLEDQASRPLLDHPNNLIDAAAQPVDRGVADPHIMLQDGAVAEIHAGTIQYLCLAFVNRRFPDMISESYDGTELFLYGV